MDLYIYMYIIALIDLICRACANSRYVFTGGRALGDAAPSHGRSARARATSQAGAGEEGKGGGGGEANEGGGAEGAVYLGGSRLMGTACVLLGLQVGCCCPGPEWLRWGGLPFLLHLCRKRWLLRMRKEWLN